MKVLFKISAGALIVILLNAILFFSLWQDDILEDKAPGQYPDIFY